MSSTLNPRWPLDDLEWWYCCSRCWYFYLGMENRISSATGTRYWIIQLHSTYLALSGWQSDWGLLIRMVMWERGWRAIRYIYLTCLDTTIADAVYVKYFLDWCRQLSDDYYNIGRSHNNIILRYQVPSARQQSPNAPSSHSNTKRPPVLTIISKLLRPRPSLIQRAQYRASTASMRRVGDPSNSLVHISMQH